jgi:hypothetical protein
VTHQEAVDTLATERYLLNDMSEVDRAAFEEHYFSCEVCAEDVKAGHAFGQGARRVFASAAESRPTTGTVLHPTGVSRAKWYRSTALPWAMAASLAAIVAYQAASPGITSGTDATARVLHPITLRPDSRGQEAVIPPASQDGVTLALDVNGAREGADMAYDLKNAAGRQVASGLVSAPSSGTPLFLQLAAKAVAEPTRYVLSLTDSASGESVGTYRFVRQ